MRFRYDNLHDIFYIRFDESPYEESDEVQEGVIFDYNKQGKIIAMEILGASQKLAPAFRSQLLRQKAIAVSG